jgi:hypothetical protein
MNWDKGRSWLWEGLDSRQVTAGIAERARRSGASHKLPAARRSSIFLTLSYCHRVFQCEEQGDYAAQTTKRGVVPFRM